MGKTDWNIQKIRRLKWEKLVQHNLVMLVLFLLTMYYVKTVGLVSVFSYIVSLLIWIIVAHTLYTLITGKIIGTNKSKFILAFDKEYLGERSWKKRKIIEVIALSVLGILVTFLAVTSDSNSGNMELYNLIPFIGAWLGFNIGETFRIKNI